MKGNWVFNGNHGNRGWWWWKWMSSSRCATLSCISAPASSRSTVASSSKSSPPRTSLHPRRRSPKVSTSVSERPSVVGRLVLALTAVNASPEAFFVKVEMQQLGQGAIQKKTRALKALGGQCQWAETLHFHLASLDHACSLSVKLYSRSSVRRKQCLGQVCFLFYCHIELILSKWIKSMILQMFSRRPIEELRIMKWPKLSWKCGCFLFKFTHISPKAQAKMNFYWLGRMKQFFIPDQTQAEVPADTVGSSGRVVHHLHSSDMSSCGPETWSVSVTPNLFCSTDRF